MLSESSLTNTLTLSGITNIRYRVYTQSYQKTNLLSFLTCQEFFHIKSPSYVENEKPEIALITAFRHLLKLNIPSSWHIVSCAEKELISLELWVFWFNDRHTGLIDNHVLLKYLKEVKVGSFNWDQLSSSGLSPTASPQLGANSNSTASLTPGNEYKLFIKSIRNLIHTSMIEKKGTFALGEFYIYPNKTNQDIVDTIADGIETMVSPIQYNTMLACMYNIYLTSSNLVFQPNTRRMRIRPLIYQDGYIKHKKVLLCPTGEHAYLISFKSLPTLELQEKALNHWTEFYHLAPNQLKQQQQQRYSGENIIPSLVTIKNASDEIIIYPSRLIFVPTETKLTPSAVSGLNGIMEFNHGLTEDLGAKASRLAYHQRLKQAHINDPMMYSGNVIIHALSMMDTNYQQDQILLHRALIEPVISSPIMNLKSVIPLHTTPLLGNNNDTGKRMMTSSQHSTPPNVNYNMNLAEFAKAQFQLGKKEESVESILDGPNPLNVPNIAINNKELDKQSGSAVSQLLSMKNPTVKSTSQSSSRHQSPMVSDEQDNTTEDNAVIDDFNLMYDLDATGGNTADPWDTNEDFGNLDLDVTEADFDFFKTPAPTSAAPLSSLPPAVVTTPSNLLVVIPMDIVPVKQEEEVQQQEGGGEPMMIEEQADTSIHGLEKETEELTPNNDSLFTPFVMSNTSTEDVSMESSNIATVESISTSTPHLSQQPIITQQKKMPPTSYPKSTPTLAEPSTTSFVPRDFLPVPMTTNSMDAKYIAGGKFMYNPSASQQQPQDQQHQQQPHVKKRESFYSPDYVPKKKKVLARKRAEPLERPPSQDVNVREVYLAEENDNSASSGSGNSNGSSNSSSGSSSNSSSSSEEEEEDNDEDFSADDNDNLSSTMIDKRLRTLKKFQKSIIYSLLKATPAPEPVDRFQHLDYDTPFAPTLASEDDLKPIKWRSSQAMEQSLTYLCQQAVGYPFTSGGLTELSQNGGEIEGEAGKIMVARRTNLMQMTRGVVTHVPCLQTDRQSLILEFMDLLKEIFVSRNEEMLEEQEGNAAAAMTTRPRLYMNAPLGSVDVKGPLTIQQYFDLGAESQNQAHSKYGKYQIKKKRPDEPSLASLKKPNIIVSRYDDFLQGKPIMISFWEKLGLEPYSSKKQVQYLVVYPESIDMEGVVQQFFKSLSTVYDGACRLGKHDPVERVGPYRRGLVPVPVSASSEQSETGVRHPLKSYEETCENLGRCLASENTSNNNQQNYTVIYMVNPGPHMSSYLDMCRCFYKLKEEYNKISGSGGRGSNRHRLVLQLVPIDHILRPSAFGGYTMLGMKDITFSVYTKCYSVISRKVNSLMTTDLYAPPFILEKPLLKAIQFKLDDIRPFPVILDQNAHLHMAYCFSYDRVWISVVWIDGRGELLEYALFSRKSAFKEAWERTLKIAKRTDFPWTIVVTKIGLLFHEELVHWLKYIQSSNKEKYWVTIVGLDFETGLNLHLNPSCSPQSTKEEKSENVKSQPQTPTMVDPYGKQQHQHYMSPHQQQQRQKQKQQQQHEEGVYEAQCLLLNHRISYSQKRERAFKGMLRTEAITEKENWMTPLATGYLIHHSLPNKNMNPCMEQFNHEPFIAEVHLLYNHTPHSAYSTLQDIIKMMYALSFVNPIPSSSSASSYHCLPFHVVLAERLSRLLLIVDDP